MKRSWILVLAAFLAAPVLGARMPASFEGVPFGTHRDATKSLLMEKLKIHAIQGFSGVDYRGPNGLRMVEEDDIIILRGYRLKEQRMDVALFFNVNGKFFRYQYEAQRRPASYFETAIRDDALFLSKHLQKSYGSPSFQMNPKLVEMRPGAKGFFWRWTKGKDTVYTAIAAGDYDFGAIAVVSDDALQREPIELRPVANVPDPTEPALNEMGDETFETISSTPTTVATVEPEIGAAPTSIPGQAPSDSPSSSPIPSEFLPSPVPSDDRPDRMSGNPESPSELPSSSPAPVP